MSKTVDVRTAGTMYSSFLDIYPEFAPMVDNYRSFNWGDDLRKILINLNLNDMHGISILFSVRKNEEGEWDQFSALLIPGGE